jgi:hypothetical protein
VRVRKELFNLIFILFVVGLIVAEDGNENE